MDASAIISAIGVIITGVLGLWFKYNQKTKDKLTDLKIEQFKQEQEIKNKRRNDSSAIVFGEYISFSPILLVTNVCYRYITRLNARALRE